jgi:hypothetical protein
MMDLLDPFAQPEISLGKQHMAPRLASLDGKTLYLVDTGFTGSYEFLEEAQKWLSHNRPEIKAVLKKKDGNAFSDAPPLWKEIKEKAWEKVVAKYKNLVPVYAKY